MTHANHQSKLLKILEEFMQRKADKNKKEYYDVSANDAASFYDKYRWYFKNKQHRLMVNTKDDHHGKKHGKRRLFIGEASDKVPRERVRRRRSYPPTYVIRVKDDASQEKTERTITFEKKTDYAISAPGGPGIDRWVARVVMSSQDNYKDDQDSVTTATESQITEESSLTSSKKSLPSSESKFRSKGSMKNGGYRLRSRRNARRSKHRIPENLLKLYQISALETAKVSVKYDVALDQKESSDLCDAEGLSRDTNQKHPAKKPIKLTPVHSQHRIEPGSKLKLGTQQVISLSKRSSSSPSQSALDTIFDESEDEQNLKRQDKIISLQQRSKMLKPMKQKPGSMTQKRKLVKEQKLKSNKARVAEESAAQSSEERRFKSPSSSTFDPDRLFKQMRDTTEFIMKAPMLSKNSKPDVTSPKFPSRADGSSAGDSQASSSSENAAQKSHHPRHRKNRAQDELQRMIDEEKILVNEAIKQLNSTWTNVGEASGMSTPAFERIQEALSIAIAKARLSDTQPGLPTPSGATKIGNPVMRRRVVPPVKEKSPTVATTVVGSNDNFFITDTTKLSQPKSKLGKSKPKAEIKRSHLPKVMLTNEVRSLSKDRNETVAKDHKPQLKHRPFPTGTNLPRLHARETGIQGNFEASISSIKPGRRIANLQRRMEVKQRA